MSPTHAQKSVAKEFASKEGILVDLGPYTELKTPICGFNTSKISCFPEEKEILFFGGDTFLQINDIQRCNYLIWQSHSEDFQAIQGVTSLAKGTLCASRVCYNVKDKIVELMLSSLALSEEHPKQAPWTKRPYIQKLFEYQLSVMRGRATYDWTELMVEAKWLHPVVLKVQNKTTEKLLNFWNLSCLFPATKSVTLTLPVCTDVLIHDFIVSLSHCYYYI